MGRARPAQATNGRAGAGPPGHNEGGRSGQRAIPRACCWRRDDRSEPGRDSRGRQVRGCSGPTGFWAPETTCATGRGWVAAEAAGLGAQCPRGRHFPAAGMRAPLQGCATRAPARLVLRGDRAGCRTVSVVLARDPQPGALRTALALPNSSKGWHRKWTCDLLAERPKAREVGEHLVKIAEEEGTKRPEDCELVVDPLNPQVRVSEGPVWSPDPASDHGLASLLTSPVPAAHPDLSATPQTGQAHTGLMLPPRFPVGAQMTFGCHRLTVSAVCLKCLPQASLAPGSCAGVVKSGVVDAVPDLLKPPTNQQMHGKTAFLKSPVSCTEKLDRVQESPDSRTRGFLVPGMECLLCSLPWSEGLKSEEIKCSREGTPRSKYNQQYHKLFKDIPLEEEVLKACSCALQRDLLLHGRLYISKNWLCFYASLFGKDIKVVIPVLSVQMIKKHKMARLLPNGLAITTNTSQKVSESSQGALVSSPFQSQERTASLCFLSVSQYVFVSLLSRDSVYDMLRSVCTHLQPSSKKSLSVREFPEEPECESLEVLTPEMKWRKGCPASRSPSLPDSIPCVPQEAMDSTDSFFPSRKPAGTEHAACEEQMLDEELKSEGDLRLWDYQLLKVFFVLICFLVLSSFYLAFRISQLEHQLYSLTWDVSVPGHR
ncbi:GRAM domain-containing protein 2A [Galemys pyrenaicus]|uniref:GRAM domain-containing protein 2A n=1 Tax=Galemys pyrenaicus TaxID=202257 RepID=A0A8J5ZMP8_GALPY|nr:GRAM domain-containing protein 2A [Galemys pyrenaicus]